MRRALLVLLIALGLGAEALPGATPAPAEAQTGEGCLPSGGASLAAHPSIPEGDFVVVGRGWGHGVGMSQYGAYGAALLGCRAEQILATYYPGASVETANVEGEVVVGLVSRADVITVQAVAGEVPWRRVAAGQTGQELPRRQPEGSTWRVAWDRAAGRYQVHDVTAGAPGPENLVWEGGSTGERVQARLGSGGARRVALPAKGGREYAHGDLELFGRSGAAMSLTVRLPTVNQYLYGLAEMPSSWHPEALKAQAITGRSYVANRRVTEATRTARECRCDVVDTPADQVYAGYAKESEPSYGQRWVAAVDATPNRVLWYAGRVATGFYSSSHGGQSESNAFSAFFAPPATPYLQPVDDSRWEREVAARQIVRPDANGNSVHAWARAYSRQQMTAALSSLPTDGGAGTVGAVRSITTPDPKGAAGRIGHPGRGAGGVRIQGDGGVATVSGLAFLNHLAAADLAVPRRSELFVVLQDTGVIQGACEPTEAQSGNTTVTRSSGPGRVETSVAVSADHWTAAPDAVLATAGGYADALSAAALAARLDAPLLLTAGDALAASVRTELARLGVARVHLMGGEAALSAGVERDLVDAGYDVTRVAGGDRFATARAAALAAGPSASADVAVALGTNWPDAVSAGTLAGSRDRIPTLLTTATSVPASTLQGLRDLGARRVLLIGGTGVVGEGVADRLRAEGYDVARRAGANRFATSVAVAQDALARSGAATQPVLLASGGAFPDALAAGALSARLGAPVVLVPRCGLAEVPQTAAFLRDAPFDRAVIVGGTGAVSDRVREEAAAAIRR